MHGVLIMAGSVYVGAEVRRQIENLVADYAHAIDDDRLEEWPEFFVDECSYRIINRDNHEKGMPIGVMDCSSKGIKTVSLPCGRRMFMSPIATVIFNPRAVFLAAMKTFFRWKHLSLLFGRCRRVTCLYSVPESSWTRSFLKTISLCLKKGLLSRTQIVFIR